MTSPCTPDEPVDPAPRSRTFSTAFAEARSARPGSWNSVTTGLSAVAAMLMLHGWLLVSQHNTPSLVGVVLLPVGAGLVVHGWVGRGWVMLAGVVAAFVGAAGPFWIMNAT